MFVMKTKAQATSEEKRKRGEKLFIIYQLDDRRSDCVVMTTTLGNSMGPGHGT